MRTERFRLMLPPLRHASDVAWRVHLWSVVMLAVFTAPLTAQPGPGYTGPTRPAAADAATPLPLYATRQNVFAIPFTVDRRIVQPVEVHLYVSLDQGRTWQLYARQSPSTTQFTFRASGDREYWFSSRTLDGTQPTTSQNPLQPELRVVVDTAAPQIELNVRAAEGGAVTTSWQTFDQNLLASSLKLEYQEGVGQSWKPIEVRRPADNVVQTTYQDQLTWKPESSSPTITIRAEVRDRAGNMGVVNRRLLLPSSAVQRSAPADAMAQRPADPFVRHGRASEGAVVWPSDNATHDTYPNQPPSNWPTHANDSPSFAGPTGPASSGAPGAGDLAVDREQILAVPAGNLPGTGTSAFTPLHATTPAQPTALRSESSGEEMGGPPDLEGGGPSLSEPFGAPAAPENPPAASAAPDLPPSDPGRADIVDGATMLPPGERPQMTSSPRFRLDYDVDAVGPSGVAEVQLWATPDGGRTWRLWGTDEDLQSPFDVAVQEEGIFGFHVVVVGRNGMAGRKPRSGDLADVWVGVDTTAPTARLTSATYGTGSQTGKLVIQWQAADALLDPRGVTLSFSESPQGPWTVIASSLPNSGQFVWAADPQLPPSVYLQLQVRDAAGNTATDQTSEPVLIDGLAPKARIRGILPMQEIDREAFRLPRRG